MGLLPLAPLGARGARSPPASSRTVFPTSSDSISKPTRRTWCARHVAGRGAAPRAPRARKHRSPEGGAARRRGQRLFDELWQDTRYAVRRSAPRSRSGRRRRCSRSASASIWRSSASFTRRCCGRCRTPMPDRLVAISSRNIESGREHLTAPLDFFDFERRASSFARVAAYYPPGFTLTGGEQAERVSGARASSGIFDVFGVQPALGRGFVPAEDRAGAPPVAVISHALWMRRYHGNRAAVGQPIVLSGRTYTLVGVLPEGFHSPAMWPRMPEVWVPLGLDPNVGRRDARMLRVIGRLRPDVTVDQARAELTALAAAPRGRASGHEHGHRRDCRGPARAADARCPPVALCACRGRRRAAARRLRQRRRAAHRRRAGAAARVRHAPGARRQPGEDRSPDRRGEPRRRPARRRRRVRAGAVGERLSGRRGHCGGRAAGVGDPHRADDVRRSASILSLACTTACALVAAFDATRAGDLRVVRGAGASTPRRGRGRAVLIGVEAALSLALLVGAALLIRSFYALQLTESRLRPGARRDDHGCPPRRRDIPPGPVLAGFYDRVVERVKALPGVEARVGGRLAARERIRREHPVSADLGGLTRPAGDAGRDPGGRARLFPDDRHPGRRRTSVRPPRRRRRAFRRRDQRDAGARLLRLGETRSAGA